MLPFNYLNNLFKKNIKSLTNFKRWLHDGGRAQKVCNNRAQFHWLDSRSEFRLVILTQQSKLITKYKKLTKPLTIAKHDLARPMTAIK